jgi:flagellar hook protein FlgE
MSFQQGLSGLNGAAKSLDVIGNNIANASTVGFKGSQAQFADIYASSLNGVSSNQPGIGVKVGQIAQQFTQGNIESSSNPLDLAINGGGFFRTEFNGELQYSRNGQFGLDREGFIINAQGAKLTGYQSDAKGAILGGSPTALKIDNSDLQPVATSTIDAMLNLDSRVDAPNPAIYPFKVSDPLSFNSQTSIDIYDSLGNSHVLSSYYVKQAPIAGSSEWKVYKAIDGVEITQMNAAANSTLGKAAKTPAEFAAAIAAAATTLATAGTELTSTTLTFNQDGTLTILPTTLSSTVDLYPANGARSPQTIVTDFVGTTQYGASSGEKASSQNGYTAGQLTRFSVDQNGVILAQYSNGQSHPLGQVALADFANPNGLMSLGNNAWSQTALSGVALVGTPGSGRMGALQSSSVESSNVDLTAELVNMITAQRVYQANAQTIKTQDSVLQTLVNLR